jgi:hypothetical protein
MLCCDNIFEVCAQSGASLPYGTICPGAGDHLIDFLGHQHRAPYNIIVSVQWVKAKQGKRDTGANFRARGESRTRKCDSSWGWQARPPDSLDRLTQADLIGVVRELIGEVGRLRAENEKLSGAFAELKTEHQAVKDELARLKSLPPRPPQKPSGMGGTTVRPEHPSR